MSEILFILSVVFVAYLVCGIVTARKTTAKSTTSTIEPEQPTVLTVEVSSPPEPVPEQITPKTIKSNNKIVTNSEKSSKKGLKNPKTGEIATSYNNYIFTKRWIKEALVEEGLLEKIYKTKEITPQIEAQIKEAIAKLETIDAYKV